MRILYVEDNEVNRALVERVMRARQCSVVFQDEGEGALEVLAEDHAIDLILLDIELAGSMTGLDVIRTMRARNDHRPVVAVTAYAMMGDRERILEAGCDQYLPKPLVVTDLLNMIDHYQAEFAQKAAPKLAAEQPAPAVKPAETTSAEPPAPEVKPVETTAAEQPVPVAKPVEIAVSEPQPETKADEVKTTETAPSPESAASVSVPPASPGPAPMVESVTPPAAPSDQTADQEPVVEDKKPS